MSAGHSDLFQSSGTILAPLWSYKVMLVGKYDTGVVHYDGLYQSRQRCLCKLLFNWFLEQ